MLLPLFIELIRGRVDSLSLYEITDNELGILEKGSPNSIYLNFGIFLASIGMSFLIALLTVEVQSTKVFTIFVVLCCIGILGGSFLIFLWYRMKGEVSDVVAKIKKRIAEQDSNELLRDESSS